MFHEEQSSAIKGRITQQFQMSEENLEIPEQMPFLTVEQLEKALTTLPELTEDEMTQIFKMVRGHQDRLDVAAATRYQTFYRDYMNEEQYQGFVQLLSELLAEKGIER